MAEACAAETCQHTCAAPDRRPHAWTLRYSVNGKQKEESFRDDMKDVPMAVRQAATRRLLARFAPGGCGRPRKRRGLER
jgi:hypothetical protein